MRSLNDIVPSDRTRTPAVCVVVFSFLVFVGCFFLESVALRELLPQILLTLSVETSLYSCCLLIEEWLFHLRQRYGGSVERMLRACFSRANLVGVGVAVLVLMVNDSGFTLAQGVHVTVHITCYLLLKVFGVLGPAPVEVSEVCENRKLNVAHGLAWSFYLGYLKLVLPKLEEQLHQHCCQTGQSLSSKQLHILLPLNAAVTSKLEENDTDVRFHMNLPELQLDQAGVRSRVYKHSIYKITKNNKSYYCLVEYATPLLTLYQMSQDDTAAFGERDRRQQVLLFYKTLSHILENSLECRNRYRLILLNDELKDEPHHLSNAIIENLQQQKHEIPMNLPQEVGQAVQEMGEYAVMGRYAVEEPNSSIPELMISMPRSLRSEPVENTDLTNNTYNRH